MGNLDIANSKSIKEESYVEGAYFIIEGYYILGYLDHNSNNYLKYWCSLCLCNSSYFIIISYSYFYSCYLIHNSSFRMPVIWKILLSLSNQLIKKVFLKEKNGILLHELDLIEW